MEATHFIEVWNDIFGQGVSDVYEIEDFDGTLSQTQKCNCETIAVWRIKPTDVPLQQRLDLRKWGMGYGQIDDGESYKIDHTKYKFQSFNFDQINVPRI